MLILEGLLLDIKLNFKQPVICFYTNGNLFLHNSVFYYFSTSLYENLSIF